MLPKSFRSWLRCAFATPFRPRRTTAHRRSELVAAVKGERLDDGANHGVQ